ncbi:hypothetical protein MRX96_003580 [Rhipicephalus microplus]
MQSGFWPSHYTADTLTGVLASSLQEAKANGEGSFLVLFDAVAGPELQFFDIVAGWLRCVHGSRNFDNTRLRVLYEENRVPGVLLGDAGYACQPYLVTPFSEPGPTDTPKGKYKKAQIKTRRLGTFVERAFGVWKRRFSCPDLGMQHKAKNIPSSISTVATRTVHLPPVDRLTDSRSGNQARDLLIRKSFT